MGGEDHRQRWRKQRVGTSKGEDSHHLGGGAVASSPDHLQAGDVLGMDSGDGLHTHALQEPFSFFRVCLGKQELGERGHEGGREGGSGDS